MSRLLTATSSPARFEVHHGVFHKTALNVTVDGVHFCSQVQGTGTSWHEANKDFIAECNDLGIFLNPRIDL